MQTLFTDAIMPLKFLVTGLLLPPLFLLGLAPAQDEDDTRPVLDDEDFQTASEALADGLPAVAAQSLKTIYRQRASGMDEAARVLLAETLLECLAHSGRHEELLAFANDAFISELSATPFWRATAYALRGDASVAILQFTELASIADHPFAGYAALSAANLQAGQGDFDAALTGLKPLTRDAAHPLHIHARFKAAELLLDAGRPADSRQMLNGIVDLPPERLNTLEFLQAKEALASGRLAEAENRLEALAARTRQIDPRIHDRSRILLASVLRDRDRTDDATGILLRFVSERPTSPVLHQAFAGLQALGFFQRNQPVFENWLRSESENLQALTRYHRATGTDVGLARRDLEDFLRLHPDHPLVPLASLKLAERLLEADPERSLELAKPVRTSAPSPEIASLADHLTGRAQFQLGRYGEASDAFRESATRTRDRDSVFNSAVAALYAKDDAQYRTELQQLNLQRENRRLAVELELERALFLAASSPGSALEALKAFIRDRPKHPRVPEAELAMAELFLLDFPPKPVSARKQLDLLLQRDLTRELAMQAGYVAVWTAAASGNLRETMDEGVDFLQRWPDSPLRDEVRMKLAEIHYANKDFPNAQTQFETLVEDAPDSRYAETALFFAAKAAQASMSTTGLQQAIVLWGKVVDRGGPLAEEARRQQGLVKLKQGQPDDALLVFNQVLANGDRLDPELRLATLIDKGQAYYLKSNQSEARTQLLIAAIAAYDEVRSSPKVTRFWKNQASVYKARCLEELKDFDQALQVYYEVVRRPPNFELGPEEAPDYTWYYRAGFGALALLRERKAWRAAVQLAEKMAATRGTRAEDAARIANELRLKHFIWDDYSPE